MFHEASLTMVASQIEKGIGYLWSFTYSSQDKPCLLPQIRVSAMMANSDFHGTYPGELSFIPQTNFILRFKISNSRISNVSFSLRHRLRRPPRRPLRPLLIFDEEAED
nr:hypothetical protein CFP56_26629 [Quercus suber]